MAQYCYSRFFLPVSCELPMPRPRAVSNATWTVQTYEDVLRQWLAKQPAATWAHMLGPWALQASSVTQVGLSRGLSLMRAMVENGQKSLVLQGARLETHLGGSSPDVFLISFLFVLAKLNENKTIIQFLLLIWVLSISHRTSHV